MENLKQLMIILVFPLLPILSACTYYKNINHNYAFGSVEDNNAYQQDSELCAKENLDKVCNTYSATTRTNCMKNTLTGGVDCYSVHAPERTECYHQINQDRKKQCLYQKGWRRADRHGNLLNR
jgi:hypothetical protein